MKPVDSYSAINTRLDRPAAQEPTATTRTATDNVEKPAVPGAISTTVSQLATDRPPFDVKKVSDMKQQIASGSYRVDTDALAAKMLDAGVLGVDSKK